MECCDVVVVDVKEVVGNVVSVPRVRFSRDGSEAGEFSQYEYAWGASRRPRVQIEDVTLQSIRGCDHNLEQVV